MDGVVGGRIEAVAGECDRRCAWLCYFGAPQCVSTAGRSSFWVRRGAQPCSDFIGVQQEATMLQAINGGRMGKDRIWLPIPLQDSHLGGTVAMRAGAGCIEIARALCLDVAASALCVIPTAVNEPLHF